MNYLNSELVTLLVFWATAGACNHKKSFVLALFGVLGLLVCKDQDFRTQYWALGLVDKECNTQSLYMCVSEWLELALVDLLGFG